MNQKVELHMWENVSPFYIVHILCTTRNDIGGDIASRATFLIFISFLLDVEHP